MRLPPHPRWSAVGLLAATVVAVPLLSACNSASSASSATPPPVLSSLLGPTASAAAAAPESQITISIVGQPSCQPPTRKGKRPCSVQVAYKNVTADPLAVKVDRIRALDAANHEYVMSTDFKPLVITLQGGESKPVPWRVYVDQGVAITRVRFPYGDVPQFAQTSFVQIAPTTAARKPAVQQQRPVQNTVVNNAGTGFVSGGGQAPARRPTAGGGNAGNPAGGSGSIG
jgi:hypothetical protein